MRRLLPVVLALATLFVASTLTAQDKVQLVADKENTSWLKADKVAEGVWRIDDHKSDNMYLVEGSDKALLIDTGLGVAKLADFVKTLTSKPVTVVNTHGHQDHAGGDYQFKAVYAHPADFEYIQKSELTDARKGRIERSTKESPSPDLVPVEDALKAPLAELMPLKDGFVFDLGGRKLEVIHVPGHTPGEIVLLDAAHKIVFSGDNDNALVWLFLPMSLPLETYLQSLQKLQKRAGEFETIYPGHGGALPRAFVAEQIACVESILDGTAKSEPYHSFAGDAGLARYKTAEVAYDPAKLRVKK